VLWCYHAAAAAAEGDIMLPLLLLLMHK